MRGDDDISNTSNNETFHEVVQARVSRRGFLGGSAAVATATALGGVGTLLKAIPAQARPPVPVLGFTGIAPFADDIVHVPEGYDVDVLIAWGDPVGIGGHGSKGKADASDSAADQAKQWGMHNDGIVYFPIKGSRHGLIVQNSEYTDDALLFPDGIANWTAEKSSKVLNAHGVNIIEIKRGDRHDRDDDHHHRNFWDWHKHKDDDDDHKGRWRVVRPSKYARRITGQTPILIGGPAAGDPRLKTSADPSGKEVLGTLNNCAMGFTPWGTYLACEENFNGYFFRTTSASPPPPIPPRTVSEVRYGISAFESGTRLHTTHPRFNADVERNEPNRFGWVVEIDPFRSNSKPVKRTALGRVKHEGAWVQETKTGRIVVYTGDDQQNEYIYRYVSNKPWRQALKMGLSPLDDGILYVAKFNADGNGTWLELSPNNPVFASAPNPATGGIGWTLNDILINTRLAADVVGATKMDRPEWIDTFPDSLTAVATLTNNSSRGVGAGPVVDAANPRGGLGGPSSSDNGNSYGHIITWSYKLDFDGPNFFWDIYLLAGDPAANTGDPLRDSNVNGDKFGSPDGIYVAPSGRLWIQTDVSSSTVNANAYAGFGNNLMLASDPVSREVRRFLTGPHGCEVTGCFATPDEKTMFVGIQHPGEAPVGNNDPNNPTQFSSWPNGQFPEVTGGRPRSALLVITKKDGGVIGS